VRMKTPVSDLLTSKGNQVVTISPTATVFEAITLMAEKSIGALPVVNRAGKIAGILSERDCFRKVILVEKAPRDTAVRDIMSRKVTYVNPDRTVDECMHIMTEKKIRHLPVLDGEKLVGLISIGDCVKFLVSQQDQMIHNLEKYIEGSL
ncbi:MAG: CBS domain-containing protein, partial [Kiritimatiellia bacterium]|nr:CBS domain-containing protein [Kiritimatiellia bacterium]